MRNAGVWAGVIILGYAIIIFYQSLSLAYKTSLGPGPGFFPRWLSGGLIILGILYIWDSIKNEVILINEVFPKGRARDNILATLAAVIMFMLIVSYVGFTIASTVLLLIMFIREYKWYTALGASIVISLVLLFVFQSLLGVSLPVNELGW